MKEKNNKEGEEEYRNELSSSFRAWDQKKILRTTGVEERKMQTYLLLKNFIYEINNTVSLTCWCGIQNILKLYWPDKGNQL